MYRFFIFFFFDVRCQTFSPIIDYFLSIFRCFRHYLFVAIDISLWPIFFFDAGLALLPGRLFLFSFSGCHFSSPWASSIISISRLIAISIFDIFSLLMMSSHFWGCRGGLHFALFFRFHLIIVLISFDGFISRHLWPHYAIFDFRGNIIDFLVFDGFHFDVISLRRSEYFFATPMALFYRRPKYFLLIIVKISFDVYWFFSLLSGSPESFIIFDDIIFFVWLRLRSKSSSSRRFAFV